MKISVTQESLFIPIQKGVTLHLRHIFPRHGALGEPVLMLHGAIENGRVFYSERGKGLAPYLAQHGLDIYVADLRGRGKSTPPIGRSSRFGQTEAITEDIPAFLEAIRQRRGDSPQHWVAHSWGGVLLFSFLARFPDYGKKLKTIVCFGTKRTIRVRHFKKRLVMDLCWDHFGRLLVKIFGYLPTTLLKVGSDNETDKSHLHVKRWVQPSSLWIDPDDGFDYGGAILTATLPPTLHFAGAADSYLGHPRDVRDFIQETHLKNFDYVLLSKEQGHLHDYGHVNMLTHPDAAKDHFPAVLAWIKPS